MMDYSIGYKLKALRKKLKLRQEDVAKQINLSRSAYAYYESGKSLPSINTLRKIATIFNTTVDELSKPITSLNEEFEGFEENENEIEYLTNIEKNLIVELRKLNSNDKADLIDEIIKTIKEKGMS